MQLGCAFINYQCSVANTRDNLSSEKIVQFKLPSLSRLPRRMTTPSRVPTQHPDFAVSFGHEYLFNDCKLGWPLV